MPFVFSMMMGRILYYLDKIPPVSWIRTGLVKSTSFIQRRAKKGKVDISSDELEQALALTKQDNDEDRVPQDFGRNCQVWKYRSSANNETKNGCYRDRGNNKLR